MATTPEELLRLLQEQSESINQSTNAGISINDILSVQNSQAGPAFNGLRGVDINSLTKQERSRIGFQQFSERGGPRDVQSGGNVLANALIQSRQRRNQTPQVTVNDVQAVAEGRPSVPITQTGDNQFSNIGNQPQNRQVNLLSLQPEQRETVRLIIQGINELSSDKEKQAVLDNLQQSDPVTASFVRPFLGISLETEKERTARQKREKTSNTNDDEIDNL